MRGRSLLEADRKTDDAVGPSTPRVITGGGLDSGGASPRPGVTTQDSIQSLPDRRRLQLFASQQGLAQNLAAYHL
jgi:hypothetical protein